MGLDSIRSRVMWYVLSTIRGTIYESNQGSKPVAKQGLMFSSNTLRYKFEVSLSDILSYKC